MVDVNTQNKTISVNVSSSGVSSNVNASGDTTLYYSNKAREWAISNRIVDGVDYSSKYYAGRANQSALNAQNSAQSAQDSYNNFQDSVDGALSTVNNTAQGAITTIDTKSDEAIETINNSVDGAIEDIEAEANEQIANIERTGFYMRDDKLYFINSVGEEEEFKTNDNELNNPYTLFDSKYVESPLYNISWLLANGSYNGSNAVHPSAYQALLVENNAEVAIGSTVTLPIGTEYTKRGLRVKLSTDSDITDYDFVVNTSDETFRLPIKVNLASGKAVVGNGNQIYLSQTAGTKQDTPIYIAGSSGQENLMVDAIQNVNQYAALTSDPTKSGIETSPQGLYLYFYVGETVQNANLINAGRIEEKLSTKVDKFDAYKHSIPDYTNTIQVGSANNTIAFTSYTAPVSGLLNLGWGSMTNAANTIKILVNGHGVAWGYKTGSASFTTSFPVNAGDVVTWQHATGTTAGAYVYGFLCPYKEEGGN